MKKRRRRIHKMPGQRFHNAFLRGARCPSDRASSVCGWNILPTVLQDYRRMLDPILKLFNVSSDSPAVGTVRYINKPRDCDRIATAPIGSSTRLAMDFLDIEGCRSCANACTFSKLRSKQLCFRLPKSKPHAFPAMIVDSCAHLLSKGSSDPQGVTAQTLGSKITAHVLTQRYKEAGELHELVKSRD